MREVEEENGQKREKKAEIAVSGLTGYYLQA